VQPGHDSTMTAGAGDNNRIWKNRIILTFRSCRRRL